MTKDLKWLKEEVLELKHYGNPENNQAEVERDIGRRQMWAWNNCVDRIYELINQLDEPEANSQIDKLAKFILSEVEGEPSQSQGAVDTAIRIIQSYQEPEPQNITLKDIKLRLWELSSHNRKDWLEHLNDEFQEGYIVPLGLKTTDGEEQYLTYNGSYFASRRDRCLQQTFVTLEEIPEFYRDLAVRVL